MSIVLKNSVFLCLLCGLFSSFALYAQDINYRVDVRYIQRFTWVGDEYAMRYEVIIERYENRRYTVFFRDFTENEYIEVSLPAGNFRYQVIPRDYLDSPIPVTEWTEFEVLRASGNVETSEANQIPMKLFDIYLGAVYLPLLPVYNANLLPETNISFVGAGLKFGMVFNIPGFFNPGAELTASWNMFGEAHSIAFELNFLGQIRFPGRPGSRRTENSVCALNFRAGAGVSLLSDKKSESLPKLNIFNVNLGVSFLALVTRNFYIEAGADCPQFISGEHFGYFRPFVSLGARF